MARQQEICGVLSSFSNPMRVTPMIAGLFAAVLLLSTADLGARETIRVRNLDGQLVNPLQPALGASATALIFVSTTCPLSNRYAPDLHRLSADFRPKNVRFWLVYANPLESASDIRAHLKTYDYAIAALRDPEHQLVRLAGVTITPEVAVFDRQSRITYRGRIDNRYPSVGVTRPTATEHDLVDALTAIISGRPVVRPVTQAVGCYLSDGQP
jgi:AhpC/TSA family